MGRGLARAMLKRGHEVTVIDKEKKAFDRPDTALINSIHKIVGIGFDRDVLLQAGIERADAVTAVTTSDETNALIARIAKERFRVPSVVARSYDSKKAEIYKRLGIQAVSTTEWGVSLISELVASHSLNIIHTIGNGSVNIIRVEALPKLEGKMVREFTVVGEIGVLSVKRGNKAFVPLEGTVIRKGDVLYFNVMTSAREKLKQLLGMPV